MPSPEIRIGDLDHFVDFEQPVGFGGGEYESVTTGVPANVRMAGGNELLRFGAQTAVAATVITVRYRADLKADWRIRIPAESRTFQITNYGNPDGKRIWTQIFATEVL